MAFKKIKQKKQHQPGSKLTLFARQNDVSANFRDCNPSSFPIDNRNKGRILVVDVITPTPDRDSGSLDTYNYLKIFKDLGYHVTFIPADLKYCRHYTNALQRLGVHCIHKPNISSLPKAIKYYAPMADFVLLYRASIAAPLINMVRKHAPHAKLLFDAVDLHHIRKMREAEISKSPIKLIAAKRMRNIELGVIKKADATILLSSHEVKLVRELIPKAKLFHIPVVRDIPKPSGKSWEKRRDIVFIGGYQHSPNIDAVLFFVKEVWPNLRALGFSGRFIIAGSDMPPEIKALAADDIIIHGYVSDLSDLFGACRFSVAPLRYGAGMKGKVISSLSHGLPCIGTSTTIEGTDLVDGENILVKDDPKEMARLIQQVYNNKELWERLSEAGLIYCIKNCSMDAVKKKINLMLSELVES